MNLKSNAAFLILHQSEVKNMLFTDLQPEVLGTVARHLPLKQAAQLRTVSRTALPPDAVAYADPLLREGLTIGSPFVRELIQNSRDGTPLPVSPTTQDFRNGCIASKGRNRVRELLYKFLENKPRETYFLFPFLAETATDPAERKAILYKAHSYSYALYELANHYGSR